MLGDWEMRCWTEVYQTTGGPHHTGVWNTDKPPHGRRRFRWERLVKAHPSPDCGMADDPLIANSVLRQKPSRRRERNKLPFKVETGRCVSSADHAMMGGYCICGGQWDAWYGAYDGTVQWGKPGQYKWSKEGDWSLSLEQCFALGSGMSGGFDSAMFHPPTRRCSLMTKYAATPKCPTGCFAIGRSQNGRSVDMNEAHYVGDGTEGLFCLVPRTLTELILDKIEHIEKKIEVRGPQGEQGPQGKRGPKGRHGAAGQARTRRRRR